MKLQRGFTLLEMLVVIGVMIMLTATLIIYTRSGGRRIILFREQAKLVSMLTRARGLTTNLYRPGAEKICGYGVRVVDMTTYELYKDLPGDGICPASNSWSGEIETLETFTLKPLVSFSDQRAVSDIFFLPPNPSVYFDGQPATGQVSFDLVLEGGDKNVITINRGGQITVQ